MGIERSATRSALLGLTVLLGFARADLVINEIDIDQLGADNAEFVEILNTGPASVHFNATPHTLVFFNGDDDSLPVFDASYQAVALSGSLGPGEFLLIAAPGVANVDIVLTGGASNFIQNGPDAIALYADAVQVWTGQQPPTTVHLVDAIAYATDDEPDESLQSALGLAESYDEWDGLGSIGAVFSIARSDNAGPFVTGSTPTPGAANDSQPPVFAVPNVTLLAQDAGSPVAFELTGEGGAGGLTFRVETLPESGQLRDGSQILAPSDLPHDVGGTLSYASNLGFTGLDAFTFVAIDALDRVSDPAVHELGVQSGGIVMTEVMHSPGTFDTPQDQRIFEFIEVFNLEEAPVVLTRLDANAFDIVDTTDNLFTDGSPVVIPPRTMRILAPGGATPDADVRFACEWGLDEADIIRVDHESWETMFPGARALLFGLDGRLLDGVNFHPGDFWPLSPGASQSVKQSFLDIFDVELDAFGNDLITLWPYSGPGNVLGLRTSYSGVGHGSPGFIPADLHEDFEPLPECLPPPLGACCVPSGQCAGLTEPFCADRDGDYHGDNVVCSEAPPCPQPPTGACCLPNGGCVATDSDTCVSLAGDLEGVGAACAAVTCPAQITITINEIDYNQPGVDRAEYIELFGVPDSSLIGHRLLLYNGASGTLYRTIHLNGSVPSDGLYVVGAPGVPNLDQLEFTTEGIQNGPDGVALLSAGNVLLDAIAYGETFIAFDGPIAGALFEDIHQSDDATSDSDAAVEVALQRIPNGLGEWEATSDFGTGPDGTPGRLNEIPLPQPYGACCFPDGSCIDFLTENACGGSGGAYQEDASLCGDDCPLLIGACCLPNGECQQITDASCSAQGGAYHGAQSTCPTNPPCLMPAVGACCLAGGNCLDEDAFDCDAVNGVYLGHGLRCNQLDADACGSQPINLTINEIHRNDLGLDDEEFIEISGPGATPMTGFAILEIEGDVSANGQSGRVDRIFSLNDLTLPGDGFLLLADSAVAGADFVLGETNTLENGSATYLLVEEFNAAGVFEGDDIDTDDDGIPDPGVELGIIRDAVALVDEGIDDPSPDLVYFAATILGPSGNSAPAGVARRVDGLDTDSPTDFCQLGLSPRDELAQPTPGAPNNCSNCPVPGDATGDGAVNLLDFAAFQRCVALTPPPILPFECRCLDFDADGVITLTDFAALNALISP